MKNESLNNFYYKIKSTEEKVINPNSEDKVLKMYFQEALNTFILDQRPPTDRLKLGTKVIVNNGDLVYDLDPYLNIKERDVKFYGVITEDLGKGNYKVFMSINSIEPNKKNRDFSRPNYSQVKSINIEQITLFKKATLC